MTVNTRPSGASIRERVVGKPTAQGDPFLAPFFETAIEHVWGGLWNRPGLELKYRSLVVVSVLAATGVDNAELKTHLRGALNTGSTREEVDTVLALVEVDLPPERALKIWELWADVRARNL